MSDDFTGRPIVEELAAHDATVHIERPTADSYLISIAKPNGGRQRFWMGIGAEFENLSDTWSCRVPASLTALDLYLLAIIYAHGSPKPIATASPTGASTPAGNLTVAEYTLGRAQIWTRVDLSMSQLLAELGKIDDIDSGVNIENSILRLCHISADLYRQRPKRRELVASLNLVQYLKPGDDQHTFLLAPIFEVHQIVTEAQEITSC